jgi:hypothetical protein
MKTEYFYETEEQRYAAIIKKDPDEWLGRYLDDTDLDLYGFESKTLVKPTMSVKLFMLIARFKILDFIYRKGWIK